MAHNSDYSDSARRVRFNNAAAQGGMVGFASVTGLIAAAMIASPSDRWSGLGFLLASIGLAYRGATSSSVVIDEEAVTTRSMLSTRRYPFAMLKSVEVNVGQTGMNGRGREFLVFNLVDGQSVPFKELNSSPSKDTESTSDVRSAAAMIEKHIGGASDFTGV